MTKISYVRGIGSTINFTRTRSSVVPRPDDSRFVRDIPRAISRRRVFNFQYMTEGELAMMLALAEIELKKAFYGDPTGIYAQGENMIVSRLRQGINNPGATAFTGNVPAELNTLAKTIVDAKYRFSPAGKSIVARTRSAIGNGFDPYADTDLVDSNCQQFNFTISQVNPSTGQFEQVTNPAYFECLENQPWLERLNEFFGESAHHMLYSHVPASNPDLTFPELTRKYGNHKNAMDKVANVSGLGLYNINRWASYGIQRHNITAKSGGEPLDPIESYGALRQDAEEQIGDFGLSAIVAVIAAVTAAVSATAQLINSLDNDDKVDFESQLPNVGEPPFGPSTNDIRQMLERNALNNGGGNNAGGGPLPGSGGSSFDTNLILPGAALAAGLYFLTQNKK